MKNKFSPLGIAHLTIHSFVVAHAITATIIINEGNDPGIILTILTIALIITLARLNDYPIDVTAALTLIFCIAGFFMGTTGAELLTKLSGSSQTIAQIVTTILVTEILGWLTFLIVKRSSKNGE